ncbi:hypothetical protein ZWY2020_048729 [Hordeum vulgare]|nr:hypothetical protein ZWY2020_048729 [Hordeum vulgare]
MGMRVLAAVPPPMVGAGALAARLLDAGAPASAVARLLAARPMAQVVDFGALAAAAGATSHAVTAINLVALATAAYGRELAAGAPGHAVAATNFVALSTAIYGRELSVGAPAPTNASLNVLAAGAPGHVVAAALDFGALDAAAYQPPSSSSVATLAAAAGVPAHVVAEALDIGALDTAACTSALAAAAGVPARVVAAALDVGALDAAASTSDPAATAGVPARVVAAAQDFGTLDAAASTSRVAALAVGPCVPARVVAAALDFGALDAAATTSRVAALAAGPCVPARAMAAALDFGALDAAASISRVAALAAGPGVPARAVAAALDFGALDAAASTSRVAALAAGPGVPARAVAAACRPPSTSRLAINTVSRPMFGRTGGGFSPSASGLRMLCTSTSGVKSGEDFMAEINALRAEMLKYNQKTSMENNKIWETINILRVKTVDTASRIMMSVYGLIGSTMVFLMPYIKNVWQADTVQAVHEKQMKSEGERVRVIDGLSKSVEALAILLEQVSAKQEGRDRAMAGMMDMLRQNGEKTEALAAAVAAAEKKKQERDKKEEEEKRARWF